MKKTTIALSLLLTSLAVALAFVVACGDMPKPPSMPDPTGAAVPGSPTGSATPASSGSAAPVKK